MRNGERGTRRIPGRRLKHPLFYREFLWTPEATNTSVVMSRHASLYSTGYHSPLPAAASSGHY
jgi:hypothetical protein